MLHLAEAGPEPPRLPEHRLAAIPEIAASALVHAMLALTIASIIDPLLTPSPDPDSTRMASEAQNVDLTHVVFLASDPRPTGSGGGGGGNRQTGPIPRAEGTGSDAVTLRVRRSAPPAPEVAVATAGSRTQPQELSPVPHLVLDAKPLASGAFEQMGLPGGSVLEGTSRGPGSGGGVGTGVGMGIGSGRGPGIGEGWGGGIGGGPFRPGGAVSAPRLILEVKPSYTNDALAHGIQGTVTLEVVVTGDGRPAQIRVVRSLDPDGLDDQAIAAVRRWRFEPGRLAGAPVDVLVTIMLDFAIR